MPLASLLGTFATEVLPVAAVMGVGFAVGRMGTFANEEAQALNRFVFFVAVPALLVSLVVDAPLQDFDVALSAAFLTSEVIIYAATFAVARYGFRRELREALLLGMAAAFVNHVFFVLPMAISVYGEAAALPVLAIITVDTIVIFAGTVLAMDALSRQGASPIAVLLATSRNPQVLAIGGGLLINLTGLPFPEGALRFVDFVGASASPVALFALGIVLSGVRMGAVLGVAASVAAIKIVLHPMLAWLFLVPVFAVEPALTGPALLVAAGPCGAMAFVIGLRYNVNVDAIALAIVVSTVGSLIGLTLLI